MLSEKKFKFFLLRSASPVTYDQHRRPPRSSLLFPPKSQQKVHAIAKLFNPMDKASGFSAGPVMTPLKAVTHTQHCTEKKATTDSSAVGPTILSMAVKATTRCILGMETITSADKKATTSSKERTATTSSKDTQTTTLSTAVSATTHSALAWVTISSMAKNTMTSSMAKTATID